MKLIALSGGIASGKSTVARRLAELGAHHIDADALAREAVAVGSAGLEQIYEYFGADVISADGSLDRARLGSRVFENADELQALNSIVHPEVRRLANERLSSIREQNESAVVIYDVPLLVEAGVDLPWDLVVITEAPVEERIRRMVELRGMSEEDAKQRLSNQADDAARRAIADVIIDTGSSLDDTLRQTEALWHQVS
ncbi:MAG: dephospho-CoA kinase [Microbacteriaceae bacterium]|nr:dephospho-CoA kinase [Microbacteriaceae bacterium]